MKKNEKIKKKIYKKTLIMFGIFFKCVVVF